jgi:carbon-monoxide dehydrogenase medium subunit
MAPALIGLGAKVKFVGKGGENFLPIEEFFKGPGETALRNDEILTEIRVPSMSDFSEGVYLKFSPRRAMDLAMVGVACVLRMDTNNSICLDVRIVLGAVAPTPTRARKAESLIKGKKLSESLIKEAAKVAREEAKPISDIRASEWYRKEIVEVLVGRAISQSSNKIKLRATRG